MGRTQMEQPSMSAITKDPMCADCGGWDIEWMRQCSKHKKVEFCRGCECPYCAEDDFNDGGPYYEDDDGE